ncbi:exonuclease subunit SbcD [Picosynechococcus sp. PCC 73109]|uniref:exonuclease subunit SbcD n=1 Tax=Picosynechococcus sp. PCC 73109 TaxID=374982 RepID=UPI0007458862|nr:exonuclease subunit SbcD [Picosynechococcus sp. PCC 73109]AMA09916.1 exonuclease sbcCD subunit D [Picosynechococcus sp. PCC 73109]
MFRILHFADIHMGSGFSHGRVNPETGLNSRLEDFEQTLGLCIDRAIADPVDLVIFAGDAFPDATPAPYIHEAFAGQFRRLVAHNIPAVLVVGNHDQYSQGNGGASLNIYRTLAVPGFIVGDRLRTHTLELPKGPLQIITLPWLNQATLLTRQQTEGKTLNEIHQILLQKLEPILEAEIRRLNPEIPAILVGHLMADRANLGAERFLAVGKGFNIPVAFLNRSELDYVALGHVHRHQNLNPSNDPPIIYPGSIERVDFSEEKEAKGYVLINLRKGHANWEFVPLPARAFRTIKIDVSDADEPETAILNEIAQVSITDTVVRLIYKIRPEQTELIDQRALRKALKAAHQASIQAELVSQLSRPRLPELGIGQSLDPMNALDTYLTNREDLQDIALAMRETATELMSQTST